MKTNACSKPLKPIRPGAIPFWMLNDASTPAQKIAYLRACRAGGFEAVALHCRSGNLIPYASREWFTMITALVAEGRRLDMDIWLYDEDPYPSGAGGGLVMAHRPDLKAYGMAWNVCPPTCRPGSLWRISSHRVLWAGLVPDQAPHPARDLTAEVGPVRSEWFMRDWDSRYYYDETPLVSCPRGDAVSQRYTLRVPAIPRGYRLAAVTLVPSGEGSPWGSLPDLLNPEAFTVFRTLILDRYREAVGEHYGNTIPGIFTDEAKPNSAWPVTPGLWTEFQAQFGYDLRPRLYRLFGETPDREDMQVRLDFRRWFSNRFLEAFVLPYRRYCDEAGLRLVGHFSPEDDPIDEVRNVGSAMAIMQAMSGPGTDLIVPLVGDESAPSLNLGSLRASSVRARHGTGYCISESLALAPWGVTTREARRLLAWQKTLGIDRFFLHGFYTSSEGVQNYEAPPDYGPNSSIFAGMGVLNDWLKRIERVMDGAEEAAPVAVLNSMTAFWAAGTSKTPRGLAMRASLWQTLLSALSAQVGFHLVDESELTGEVGTGKGMFQVGGRRYRILLVPDTDMLGQAACDAMRRMEAAGVRIVHFGGGAADLLPEHGPLRPCGTLPGECLRAAWPSPAWCRRALPRQTRVAGPAARHLYVRRFRDRQDRELLLAANLDEAGQRFRLTPVEPGRCWEPLELDGDATLRRADTLWTVPGGGGGLFVLAPLAAPAAGAAPVRRVSRPLALQDLAFQRLDTNTVRLCRTRVTRPGASRPLTLPYPQPYWRCSDDYRASRMIKTFSGLMPLESKTADRSLTYHFDFHVAGSLAVPPVLVLDPRCARGCCAITLNGTVLRRSQRFPLEGNRPLRLPLRRALRPGSNRLEVTFTLDNALDGLLSQLYLEGDFDLDVSGASPRLSGTRHRHDPAGWQRAGLPHYMGRGRYRWTETFSAAELAGGGAWTLELDAIIDSATCLVNGRPMGARAWEPWRWALSGLGAGTNRFELVVSGTAGNLHTLEWPDQPQGWIGAGRLERVLRPVHKTGSVTQSVKTGS